MRTLIRRRDVLTSGTLAAAGSVLGPRGSPRLADASEAPGPPAGTESSLGANRTPGSASGPQPLQVHRLLGMGGDRPGTRPMIHRPTNLGG